MYARKPNTLVGVEMGDDKAPPITRQNVVPEREPEDTSVRTAAQVMDALRAFRVHALKQTSMAKRRAAAGVVLAVRHTAGCAMTEAVCGNSGVVESNALRIMAPGQIVEANDSRFHPSLWASLECAAGFEFQRFEERLPPLVGLRQPVPIARKQWALKSSSQALNRTNFF